MRRRTARRIAHGALTGRNAVGIGGVRDWRGLAALGLLIAGFGVLVFARCMDGSLNHDEHQFLAPAALVAREGLLPYRDFPLFHVPNLIFIHAALDRLSSHLIFSAKAFAIFCSVSAAALSALIAYRAGARRSAATGVAAAGLILALLFFDPLFRATSGKTWNHDFPTLCTVLALLCTIANARRGSTLLALIAGAAVGLAMGARLTFAPVVLPLLVAHLLFELPGKARCRLVFGFAGGFLASLLPSVWMCWSAPEAFLFDNFQFPRLRLLDPGDSRAQKTMVWWRKARFFVKEVVLPGWPLFAAYLLIGLPPAIRWFRERSAEKFPSALVFASSLFVLLGCFAPLRYQYQHYFALVPLLALGLAFGLIQHEGLWKGRLALVALLAGISAAIDVRANLKSEGENAYRWLGELRTPEEWFPLRAHAVAIRMREFVPEGKILTLAPAWPLEAGLKIYPEFATGPFAWRAAALLPAGRRSELKLVAPADLDAFMAADPPAAVLTGFEKSELEKPLVSYAKRHRFRPVELGKKRIVWVP